MNEPWESMRSLDQNSLFQAACRDLSENLLWHGITLSQDDFRHLLSADILGQKAVPGVHGGVVMLGGSSRKLTKDDCTQAITLAFSIGDAPWDYGINQPRVKWGRAVCLARGFSPNDDEMAERYGD